MNDILLQWFGFVSMPRFFLQKNVLSIVFFILFASCSFSKEDRTISVIPAPMEYELQKGYFSIDSLALFSDVFSPKVKYVIDEKLAELGEEGYILDVTSGGISLKAYSRTGLFYGKMTLRQLYADNKVPCVRIKDKPRFSYRGIMVDVSRHFFSKEEIKEMINWMSVYKLNRFHWHLTDDGGWRFEVEDYPELTKKTAFRSHHLWREWWKNGGKFTSADEQGAAGGYYTKEDIKEIIKYAADRHITIIPEIEFPGHSREVFAAYPELCCAEKPYSGGTFCVGNDKTYAFMNSVLNTVMDLFPSEMVHIGGDETNTAAWEKCPKCRRLMTKENMKDIHELHNYIISEAEKILKSRGRRMIGWDEIANEKRDKSSVIMSWRGEKAGMDAAKKGYDVILTPLHYLYLDYFQASPDKEPLAHDGYTPIEKVYTYRPIPDTLNNEAHSHILGVQGNIWTEWIPNMKHWEYMAFPRTLAVAEVAWSPEEKRTWKSFRSRLGSHIAKLQDAGVNTYKLSSDIESVMNVDTVRKKLEISLKCEREDVEIRYTDNGLCPTRKSALYSRPLVVKDSLCVKAAAFKKGNRQGDVFTRYFYYHKGIGKKVQSSMRNNSGKILADGYTGGKTYLGGSWVNFHGDQEFIMDLGEEQEVRAVSTRWMQLRAGARRHLPQQVEILFSNDGENYMSGGIARKKNLKDIPALQYQDYIFNGHWNARYIKMKVKAGDGGMSVDEIVVL